MAGHGFTSLIGDFLALNSNSKVIAFFSDSNEARRRRFEESWYAVLSAYPRRCIAVDVNVEAESSSLGLIEEWNMFSLAAGLPSIARFHFLIGRLAVKFGQASKVLALGGGGTARLGCLCGMRDKLSWTVFALSRGGKEPFPSICDLALEIPEHVELVRGIDPKEFYPGRPPRLLQLTSALENAYGQISRDLFAHIVSICPKGLVRPFTQACTDSTLMYLA